MKASLSRSELLLEEVRKELKRSRTTLYRMTEEMQCSYDTIYCVINPERRQRPRVGPPRFSYELGKKVEDWLKKNSSNRANKQNKDN